MAEPQDPEWLRPGNLDPEGTQGVLDQAIELLELAINHAEGSSWGVPAPLPNDQDAIDDYMEDLGNVIDQLLDGMPRIANKSVREWVEYFRDLDITIDNLLEANQNPDGTIDGELLLQWDLISLYEILGDLEFQLPLPHSGEGFAKTVGDLMTLVFDLKTNLEQRFGWGEIPAENAYEVECAMARMRELKSRMMRELGESNGIPMDRIYAAVDSLEHAYTAGKEATSGSFEDFVAKAPGLVETLKDARAEVEAARSYL